MPPFHFHPLNEASRHDEAEGHKDQGSFTNKQGCHKDGDSKTQIGQEGILLLSWWSEMTHEISAYTTENRWLEDEISFQNGPVSGAIR